MMKIGTVSMVGKLLLVLVCVSYMTSAHGLLGVKPEEAVRLLVYAQVNFAFHAIHSAPPLAALHLAGLGKFGHLPGQVATTVVPNISAHHGSIGGVSLVASSLVNVVIFVVRISTSGSPSLSRPGPSHGVAEQGTPDEGHGHLQLVAHQLQPGLGGLPEDSPGIDDG